MDPFLLNREHPVSPVLFSTQSDSHTVGGCTGARVVNFLCFSPNGSHSSNSGPSEGPTFVSDANCSTLTSTCSTVCKQGNLTPPCLHNHGIVCVLSVYWAKQHVGRLMFKQRLSHWIVETSKRPPAGLHAYSIRGLATLLQSCIGWIFGWYIQSLVQAFLRALHPTCEVLLESVVFITGMSVNLGVNIFYSNTQN